MAALCLVTESQPRSEPDQRLSLRSFWGRLSGEGRWLLSTTAITTLGRGMVLPFTIVYLTEVRGVPLDTAGVLMGLIAVAALVAGGLIASNLLGLLSFKFIERPSMAWGKSRFAGRGT